MEPAGQQPLLREQTEQAATETRTGHSGHGEIRVNPRALNAIAHAARARVKMADRVSIAPLAAFSIDTPMMPGEVDKA